MRLSYIILAFIFLVYLPIHFKYLEDPATEEDIYYIFLEGKRILEGEDPYARVLESNMRENDKYATYFPLFYYLAAGSQWLGLSNYADWLACWRWALLFFNFGIAFLTFRYLEKEKGWGMGVLGALFWLFNAWMLVVVKIAQIDFMAVFFLLLAILQFDKRPRLSFLMFGISLAVKQIGIFLVPLFLVWVFHKERNWKKVLKSAAWIVFIPLLISVPFLVSEPEGYLKSVFFSVTRDADTHFRVDPIDRVLGVSGWLAKLPMLIMFALIYLLAWRKCLSRIGACFLIFAVFVGFNSVMFRQYMCWMLVFIPFVLAGQKE